MSGSENYEIQYFKDKLNVSNQGVTGAICATGSNDSKVLTEYLKEQAQIGLRQAFLSNGT